MIEIQLLNYFGSLFPSCAQNQNFNEKKQILLPQTKMMMMKCVLYDFIRIKKMSNNLNNGDVFNICAAQPRNAVYLIILIELKLLEITIDAK